MPSASTPPSRTSLHLPLDISSTVSLPLYAPLLRAQYLLSLQGVDVAADETLKVEEPELLTVVLEAHEAMDDAASSADLEGLAAENEERIAASESVLEEAFRGENVDLAKREAVRLRYWVNIREALRDWEQAKGTVLQH